VRGVDRLLGWARAPILAPLVLLAGTSLDTWHAGVWSGV